jgi:hypothetical protein
VPLVYFPALWRRHKCVALAISSMEEGGEEREREIERERGQDVWYVGRL